MTQIEKESLQIAQPTDQQSCKDNNQPATDVTALLKTPTLQRRELFNRSQNTSLNTHNEARRNSTFMRVHRQNETSRAFSIIGGPGLTQYIRQGNREISGKLENEQPPPVPTRNRTSNFAELNDKSDEKVESSPRS